MGTPEIYFAKAIDNSRLVKVEDPRRAREMRQFGIALACLFVLVMAYAFQHFKAIEYGYKIEALKVAARWTGRREPGAEFGRSVAAQIRSGSIAWRASWDCNRRRRAR